MGRPRQQVWVFGSMDIFGETQVGVGLTPQVLPLVTIPSTGVTQLLALQMQLSTSVQGVVQLARFV